jgi:hypothetical protein
MTVVGPTSRQGRFRRLIDLARRFRMPLRALVVLIVLTLHPAASAWAGCNFTDVVSAMKAAGETAQICQPVCEDKYRCYASAGLAIVLTEISRRKGQDKVDSFCSQVRASLDEILGDLKLIGDLTDDQISELSDAMKGLGDVAAVVNCACKTEQLQLKNEASIGACANDVLQAIGCGEIDWSSATIGGCDPVGGIIGDWVDEGLDEIVKLGCGWLWDCPGEAVGPPNTVCIAFGTQADSKGVCRYCSEFGPHVITQADGSCGCEPPYTATRIGKRLAACQCTPPNRLVDGQCQCPLGAQMIYGVCQCPIGTKASAEQLSCVNVCNNAAGEIWNSATGTCVTCPPNSRTVYVSGSVGQCEACGFGQKVSADHKSCIAACAPGQIMGGLTFSKDQTPDPSAYQCQTCPDNTYASYENPESSKGVCLPCADGTFAKAGATQCLPLNCGPGAYQDPNDPHACKSCPPTQIYIPAEKKIITAPGAEPGGQTSVQLIPGHCGCGENQRLEGDTCVCAKGATKVDLPQAGASLFACVCPTGAHLDQATNACICPLGQQLDGDKCVVPHAGVPAPRKDCATLGPRYINDPKNPAICRRCPAGQVANAERNACVMSARPTAPAIAPPPGRASPRRSLQCPPGMIPNAAGTACIRQPGMRRINPPGLLQAPARGAEPSVIPGPGAPAMRR